MPPEQKSAERDELLQRSLQLAVQEAALVGAAGSARPLRKGEDPETSDLAAADHWVSVYSELADFSRELLAEVEGGRRQPEDALRARLAVEAELKLHELHLWYWRRRRDDLRTAAAPPSAAHSPATAPPDNT